MSARHPRPCSQRGAALITSLLLLLVLTIIGVTAMQMTRMEERMAGNSRDLNLAFQGAEAALRDGERTIRGAPARPDTCSIAPCAVWETGAIANIEDRQPLWWEDPDNTRELGTVGLQDMLELAEDPQYAVEALGFVPDSLTMGHGVPEGRDFYQISGRSTGGSGQANLILQSTFTRRF